MRWYEDSWIGAFDWRKFVNENKEHFPLIYDMCNKNAYYELFSWTIMVRIFRDQEIDHPTGIVIYDERNKNNFHIYALEVYDQDRLKGNGRYLLKSFLEKGDKVSLSCLPDVRTFYEKQGFKEQGECKMIWTRGGNGNSV